MMCNLDGLVPTDGKWRLSTAEGEIVAGAVILATGSSLKKLGVPGEERLTGSGVSHCATCDAPLMRGRIVAVVGGGDSAMQEALTLAEFSSKVVILQRDAGLTGQAWYRDRIAAHPKIEVRCNVIVREILGDAEVSGVCVQAAGGGETSEIEVAAIFAYVGLTPNTAFLKDVLALDAGGLIPAHTDTRTSLPGLSSSRQYSRPIFLPRCGRRRRRRGRGGRRRPLSLRLYVELRQYQPVKRNPAGGCKPVAGDRRERSAGSIARRHRSELVAISRRCSEDASCLVGSWPLRTSRCRRRGSGDARCGPRGAQPCGRCGWCRRRGVGAPRSRANVASAAGV